jgi:hypothetical protein
MSPLDEHSQNAVSFRNKPASVRFRLDQNQVLFIPNLDDMSSEEISDTYYTSCDFKRIKSSNNGLLRKMMKKKGRRRFSDNDCVRGVDPESRQQERQARYQKMQSEIKQLYCRAGTNENTTFETLLILLASKLAVESRAAVDEALARAQGDEEAAMRASDELEY